jgi:general secretion pathway protein D
MKIKNLILITGLFLASTQVDAQFNKFKSRTNFKAENEDDAGFDEPFDEAIEEMDENDDGGSVGDLKKRLGKKSRSRRRNRNTDRGRDRDSGGGGSSADIFGRTEKDTKINVIKDKRFVNLNPETAFGPEVITSFDFPNISLVELTKHMQKLTGINLILDKDLKGKISIMAPTAITVGDAWRAFLTALNSNGYTLVKSGKFYKIVQARDIRYTPTKIYTGAYTPDTENYVMRIIPLKNINSTEVTRSFRPFMSRYGRIIDIKQTNTIIVQDTGTNIQRLLRLIKFIDVPGYEESLQIIPVENSSAQEIAKLLDKILKGKGKGGGGGKRSGGKGKSEDNISKIIAEPRTNSIIAMANAQGAEQLRRLIKKLDVKLVSGRGGQVHVFYLKYADATKIATTLTSLVSGNQRRGGRSGGARGSGSSRLSRTNNNSSTESLFNDTVKITADEDNNALVITASPTDYGTVKDVIRKLDIPRDQVYVEGMIMETTVSKGNNWGVSYLGQYGSGNARRAGFAGGADLTGLLSNNITNLSGMFVGAGIGKTFDLDVGGTTVQVNTINGLISAIAQSSSTNVLATPQILALDNEEAEFEVGEQVPTTEATNTANGSTQVSNRLQKVALNLKIKPQINKVTRMIKLKITQKIDDFSNRSSGTSAAGGVATTTRTANTTVFVRDQDTIAMGGLMRDRENFIESKVPLLGDIPVLGWLFKNKSKTRDKVNLLFFLTPRIIAPYAKAAAATTKDAINRRILHLKDDLGEKDNFKNTMKGLFDKVNKQSEGPLFDEDDADKYKKSNELSDNKTEENAPNYQEIFQNVSTKAAGVKK